MSAKIIATGSYAPEKIVTNDALSQVMDTSDEWIRTRTGIRERRIAEGDERTRQLALAVRAAENAVSMAEERFGAAGFTAQDIDLILVATCTPDMVFPATACRLQAALSIGGAAAFDISLACTGFLAALNTAGAFIESGRCKTVLLVGVDVMSRMLDWNDRNTAVLFGDGAGAAILSGDPRFLAGGATDTEEAGQNPESAEANGPDTGDASGSTAKAGQARSEASGILGAVMHSDGTGEEALYCKAMYFTEQEAASEHMDGRRVFEFAVRKVPEVLREVLSETGTDAGAVKYFVLHQANYRIIESVAKRLKEPIEKFPSNIGRYGNTTAASIPILLDELVRGGKIADGDLICMAGFGAGLSYGAALLRW